ncbi:trans-sialidase, putative [Trypanosoma cruzi]|nr:trans-sialidase, putative [Trypanosoma cruzi]
MLSRVAAVMEPRTHNRRRVTGSRGRRREGGESERQRPNMSRRVFTSAVLLLLVVMMVCCGTGVATQAEFKQSTDPKFEWEDITEGDVTVDSLGFPGLLKVGSDVFAVAEAQCKKNGNSVFTGIASQLLTMGNGNEPEEVLKETKDTLIMEEGGSVKEKKRVDVSRPTAVVNGSDIYMLAGTYSFEVKAAAAAQWELLVAVGNVSNDEGSNKKKFVGKTLPLSRGLILKNNTNP